MRDSCLGGNSNARAVTGRAQRDGEPDAAGRAGNEQSFSSQSGHSAPFFR
jgi:hypothetical protein